MQSSTYVLTLSVSTPLINSIESELNKDPWKKDKAQVQFDWVIFLKSILIYCKAMFISEQDLQEQSYHKNFLDKQTFTPPLFFFYFIMVFKLDVEN